MAEQGNNISFADESFANVVSSLPDEVLQQFSFPLFSNTSVSNAKQVDADGFPTVSQEYLWDLHKIQRECWDKAEKNPQINSHVRDKMGRMAGWGFGFASKQFDVQKAIDEIVDDPRNNLIEQFPKFCARTEIEGELFLMLTLHKEGFCEVDFVAPSMIRSGGDKGSGVIFHPTKQTFPLFFCVNFDGLKENGEDVDQVLIPSINIAYYPELEKEVKEHPDFDQKKLRFSKFRKQNTHPYDKFNGYYRFMIHWNRGFMTRRNVSHIQSTIEWVNYYENLKKYEIDHKKSSGSYLWVIEMEDIQAFRRWMSMSEEERKKTGIMQPKEPGGTLVLPPGMKLTAQNPSLPNISDQDTDIMQMVSSGLQKPQDTMLGDYRSTYASVKASQGPQGDRINDELHYFKTFLIYSFWRPILYLRSIAKKDFAFERRVEETVDFNNQEPVKKKVPKPVYKMIDVNLPTSRLEDVESIAKAYLGSKHGSVVDVLGIPRAEVAKRIGFNDYDRLRKQKATEDELYPETLHVDDQEAAQEKAEGNVVEEKPKATNEKKTTKRTRKKSGEEEK